MEQLLGQLVEHFIGLSVFTAKTIIIVIGLLVVIGVITYLAGRSRAPRRHQLDTEKLNNRYRAYVRTLQSQLLGSKEFKALSKEDRKKKKESTDRRKTVFVIDFDGDIKGAAVEELREEVTAILGIARPIDEVVLRLDSPGGTVVGYGLAAAQLRRIKDRGVPLIVCVDKVAASGGYMMACVADRILAAPFAVVGSVGVIAAFANFHRLLSKNDIEYREVTAGEFKRTVSMFGEVTPTGLEKFKTQINDTHGLFKNFVRQNRPQLDVDHIATGEYWYGTQALDLKLVDELITSDDYLSRQAESADLLRVRYRARKQWSDRLSHALSAAAYTLLQKVAKDAWLARFGY